MDIVKSITPIEIDQQMQRILNSPPFRNSPTLTRFLSFIVSETIDEKERHIKEYSIAVNVLNRPLDFNPHNDAVVRIHAGRLRRALNEYYLIHGINDPIIIRIPKGRYIPEFEVVDVATVSERPQPAVSQKEIKPVVAVFPMRIMPQNPEVEHFSTLLGERLSAELSRFRDISVIGHYSIEMTTAIEQNILEAGKSLGVDYIIIGSLQYHDQRIHVLISLLVAKTGEVMMSKSFDRPIVFPDIFSIQDEIANTVIAAIGGYEGIVSRETLKLSGGSTPNNSAIREAISDYRKFQRAFTLENFHRAFESLQLAAKEYPNHSVCWAMLGEMHLHGVGLGVFKSDDHITQGYECVLHSLKVDPLCQHGWFSLAMVHLFRKEKKACRDAALECMQLNPNNTCIVSGASVILIFAGFFDEGFPILESAIKLNPYYPWWVNGGFSFYYLRKKEYTSALYWAEKMNAEETVLDALLKCTALSYLGRKDEAEKYRNILKTRSQAANVTIGEYLSMLLLSNELIEHINSGLKKIELPGKLSPQIGKVKLSSTG